MPERDAVAVRLYNEGLAFRAQSRLQEAEGAFRRANRLFPKAANIRESLAQTLIEQRLFHEGRALYAELIASFPKRLELVTGLAASEAIAGDYAAALRGYGQGLDTALRDGAFDRAATIARGMATIQFRLGDEESALCSSELAYALRSTPDELQQHATMLAALNRFAVASGLIETALTSGTERDPRLISLYALSRFGEGRDADSRLLVDEAQQIAPREIRPQMELLAAMVWGDDAPRSSGDGHQEFDGTLPEDAALIWPPELLARYQLWQRAKEGA